MVRGQEVHLTPKEFDVLKHLIANQGKPLTHRRLLQSVWGRNMGKKRKIFAWSSISCARRSKAIQQSRNTFGPNRGWDIASSLRRKASLSHRLENNKTGIWLNRRVAEDSTAYF